MLESQKYIHNLNHHLKDLIGKVCWRINFTYGDELNLHFGEQVEYSVPRMEDERQGSWILCTRASEFKVSGVDNPIDLKGIVKNIEASETGLSLLFDTGATFDIIIDYDEKELAGWELFMPNNLFIAFGPGKRWSYLRSDIPYNFVETVPGVPTTLSAF